MRERLVEQATESEESYFISMTDMMVGLLFIFVIMLMCFAFQYRHEEQRTADISEELERTRSEIEQRLATSAETRARILLGIQRSLKVHGVDVLIDLERGILRLPDEILFESGSAELDARGRANVRTLAAALTRVLPCYTHVAAGYERLQRGCGDAPPHRIDAIFVEGHTDTDPLQPGARYRDNWELSVARAVETYRTLMGFDDGILGALVSAPPKRPDSTPVFGVTGYADTRLVDAADSPIRPDDPSHVRARKQQAKARNRRIDLRFIMASPGGAVILEIEGALGR